MGNTAMDVISHPLVFLFLQLIILVVVFFRTAKTSTKSDESISNLQQQAKEDAKAQRIEANENAANLRTEINSQLTTLSDANATRIQELGTSQKERLDEFGVSLNQRLTANSDSIEKLTTSMESKQNELRNKLDEKLNNLSEQNTKKLDEMRKTVDEKLQTTLEKRLGESFKSVSDRLEQVHRGLGEMQSLASNVGDLKRTLTNVKTRGTWAEAQLELILQDILSPEQYVKNAQIKESSQQRVEFAIKLPGREVEDEPVFLAVDSKFPTEQYDRLVEASEAGDAASVQQEVAGLTKTIVSSAKDIGAKYIDPPRTTDFAILYLPTEGLYAEIIRQPGLAEQIRKNHRVVVQGPTTITAFLSSLQMGFRTLAIEKRSSEVWQVLGAVKTEFGKFGDVLSRIKKKLDQAGADIDQTAVRTRAMNRHLSSVENMSSDKAQTLLGAEFGDIKD